MSACEYVHWVNPEVKKKKFSEYYLSMFSKSIESSIGFEVIKCSVSEHVFESW